ncbi:zinc finger protein 644 isoform X2 [Latimeria chalumnae]|uniref:zinc finger protein 644 isoform X2 n=1 Tax=Latimeria chalumnae TaxID=7897 RepID=UPI00313F10B4
MRFKRKIIIMEDLRTNDDFHCAKGGLTDEESTNKLQKSPENQMSFQRKSTLSVPEEMSRDSSAKALSRTQSTLFIHTGASTVSSENVILPKGTAGNGPVSHSVLTKTSVVNKGSASLKILHPMGQSANDSNSPSLNAVHDLQRPRKSTNQNSTQNQVLLFVPNVASTQNTIGTKQKLTTSTSVIDCEIVKSEKKDVALISKIDNCEESKKLIIENMECAKSSGESSSNINDYKSENISEIHWDPQKEFMQFLLTSEDGEIEKSQVQCTLGMEKKKKIDIVEISDFSEEGYAEVHYISKESKVLNVEMLEHYEEEPPLAANRENNLTEIDAGSRAVDSEADLPKEAIKHLIINSSTGKCSERNRTVQASAFPNTTSKENVQKKSDSSSTVSSEQEPSFFPCTKCNVNFKEKKHLHRHMMQHLDGHFRHLNVPRPYACRECGRTFRDRNSLLKHMIIHQERRQKLMEEIRELKELQDEGRNARLQCPQCVFGTNCPKTFVQHAKTHEKDKRYYCCEECNFMAVTESELECHRGSMHGAIMKSLISSEASHRKFLKKTCTRESLLGPSRKSAVYMCSICPFTTCARNILKKHVEYLHQLPFPDRLEGKPMMEKTEKVTLKEPPLTSSRTKQLMQVQQLHSFPKKSISRQDMKRRMGSNASLGRVTGLYKNTTKPQKARKSVPQLATALGSRSDSQNKSMQITSSTAHKCGFFQQSYREKDGAEIKNNASLHKGKYENSSKMSSEELHPLTLKKENASSNCCKLIVSTSDNSHNEYLVIESENICEKKLEESEYLDCQIGSMRDSDEELMSDEMVSDDALNDCPDVLQKMTVVVLQKLDPRTKKKKRCPKQKTLGEHGHFTICSSEAKPNTARCNVNDHKETSLFPSFQEQLNDLEGDDDYSSFSAEDDSKLFFKYFENADNHNYLHNEHNIEYLHSVESNLPVHNSFIHWTELSLEKKSCPYCPAVFETGVGLSNHVRGHLHRAGLSYEARHVVSPEQIASRDKVKRIRRSGTPVKRIRKVEKPESASETTCPLCGGWFDTKIGLSNHVRGHLKRLGKTRWDSNKSPICILNEMMQNEEDYEKILKTLNNRRIIPRPFVSSEFSTSGGLFLTPSNVPIKVQNGDLETKSLSMPVLQEERLSVPHEHFEVHAVPTIEKNFQPSTLIELLKKKKYRGEVNVASLQKNHTQTARKRLVQKFMIPLKEDNSLMYQAQKNTDLALQTGTPVKLRTCVHCHATFTSAVSLSNHLRAYARKKQAGLLTGTTFDCKQKKTRSRPGTKKKVLSLPNAAEDVYILKCRFCDLVFRGPLSVQEDWIKHLQRHVINANLPRTGAGMVEVKSLPKETSLVKSETSLPLLVAEAAL